MIVPVVLAAGESKRMGTPKALLNAGEQSFIRHIIDVLKEARLERIVVVLGACSEMIQKELEGANVTITINQHYQRGQLLSILKGIEVARSFSPAGILIHPVDHPFISAGLVKSLITHFNNSKSLIVLPRFGGRRGHPVLFSSELFVDIMNASPALGARAVVWQHPAETCEVNTDERGCVIDIDTQEDYSRYFSNIH